MDYLIFIIMTILIASRQNLLQSNITGVSQMSQYHMIVVAYTIAFACFYGYKFIKAYDIGRLKKMHPLILCNSCLMVLAICLPYHHNGHDLISQLHVGFSLGAAVFTVLLLLIMIRETFLYDQELAMRLFYYFSGFSSLLIMDILMCGCINGLSEIILNVAMSTLLFIKLHEKA